MEKRHSIQIVDIQIKQLNLTVHDPVACRADDLEAEVALGHGNSGFDEEQMVIAVGFKCEINKAKNKEDTPFEMIVEIIGVFSVGEEFPKDKVDHWATHNAPYILLPYIRENVASLLSRAGIRFNLPLVQVIK